MGDATLPTTKTAQDKQPFEQRFKPLFEQVRQFMSDPPAAVREAGRMLDDPVQGYTDAAIWHRTAQLKREFHRLGYGVRQQTKMPFCTRAAWRKRYGRHGLPTRPRRVEGPDGRFHRVPESKSVRFQLAFRETLEQLREKPFDRREKVDRLKMAGRVALLTWLLCDPDAHAQQPLLTEFQDWLWDSDFGVLESVQPGQEVIWAPDGTPIPLADRLVGRYWLRTELEDKDHLHELWLMQLRKALEVLAEAAEEAGHLPEEASQQAGDAAEADQRQGQASSQPTHSPDFTSVKGAGTRRTFSEGKQARVEKLARAMLMVQEHPDWSDAKIAGCVGVHPGTLSRSKLYQKAAKLARGSKNDRPKGYVTVDPDNGTADVEAVAPPGDDRSDRGKRIPNSRYFREYCDKCGEQIRVTRDQVGKKPLCDDCAK